MCHDGDIDSLSDKAPCPTPPTGRSPGRQSRLFSSRCPTGFIISTKPFGKFSCSHGGLNQSCSARQKESRKRFLHTPESWGKDVFPVGNRAPFSSHGLCPGQRFVPGGTCYFVRCSAAFPYHHFLLFKSVLSKNIKKQLKPHPVGERFNPLGLDGGADRFHCEATETLCWLCQLDVQAVPAARCYCK